MSEIARLPDYCVFISVHPMPCPAGRINRAIFLDSQKFSTSLWSLSRLADAIFNNNPRQDEYLERFHMSILRSTMAVLVIWWLQTTTSESSNELAEEQQNLSIFEGV
jgi:hypothetical protein